MRGSRVRVALLGACLLLAACVRIPSAAPPAIAVGNRGEPPVAVSILGDAVYLVDPASGDVTRVASGLPNFQAGYAAWSPDRHTLAYGDGGIVLVGRDDRRLRTLAPGASVSMPAWSPDGRRIVYGDGVGMWVVPAGGGRPIRVPLPRALAPFSFDWSPGPSIVFEAQALDCIPPTGCASTGSSDLYLVGPDGKGLRRLTRLGSASNPRWSPDGRRILFVRTVGRGKARTTQVWTVGPRGRALAPLLSVPGVTAADWSPDGRQVALLRPGPIPHTLQLWIADVDGRGLHAVGPPLPGDDGTVDW